MLLTQKETSAARGLTDLFCNPRYLPLFLPPDGGPGTEGYEGWAVPATFEPKHGHQIYLIYQGMIHNTRMALSGLGRQRDVDVVTQLYQENWWLTQLAAEDTSAVWERHWYPHNYELTALEAYLDLYVLTGNTTYLKAVRGGWKMFRELWIHPGGSMAINEGDAFIPTTGPDKGKGQPIWNTSVRFPPGSHYLCAGALVPPENEVEVPGECNLNTGELCGSSFWLKLNQRFHRLEPDNETYVSEMERSIYNVGLAAQVADGTRIRYFARLHGYKQPGYNIGTCCEGQGTRMFGQLPEYLYSHTADGSGVYIDMYAASTHRWRSGSGAEVVLSMDTDWPYSEQATLRITTDRTAEFTLSFRAPSWLATPRGSTLVINGKQRVAMPRGSYVHVKRQWQSGDVVVIELPMKLTAVRYSGRSTVPGHERFAFLYGPLLMAAIHGTGGLAPNGTVDHALLNAGWTEHDVSPFSTRLNLVIPNASGAEPGAWLSPIPGRPAAFRVKHAPALSLVPYFEIGAEHFTTFPLFKAGSKAPASKTDDAVSSQVWDLQPS